MSVLLTALTASLSVASAQPAEPPECISNPDRMMEADLNNDGSITLDEVGQRRADIFSRLDRNGDGVAEASDAPRVVRGRFNEALNTLLAEFDSSGDGALSEAEFVSGPTAGFDRADANEDDVLDASELEGLQARACD